MHPESTKQSDLANTVLESTGLSMQDIILRRLRDSVGKERIFGVKINSLKELIPETSLSQAIDRLRSLEFVKNISYRHIAITTAGIQELGKKNKLIDLEALFRTVCEPELFDALFARKNTLAKVYWYTSNINKFASASEIARHYDISVSLIKMSVKLAQLAGLLYSSTLLVNSKKYFIITEKGEEFFEKFWPLAYELEYLKNYNK
jgi:hypothetical protein